MTTTMQQTKKAKFIKSYKYKHKWRKKKRRPPPAGAAWRLAEIKFASCDMKSPRQTKPIMAATEGSSIGCSKPLAADCTAARSRTTKRRAYTKSTIQLTRLSATLCSLVVVLISDRFRAGEAFCPFKCLCNDQSLSANCTQVSSITIVPMTLNPLLKQLTLNHLPMTELSNSLSVYRQLEYLNLKSNQLRQIKYENFNFNKAPAPVLSVALPHHHLVAHSAQTQQQFSSTDLSSAQAQSSAANNQQLNSHNEQLARQLKQSIDKSVSMRQQSTSAAAVAVTSEESSAQQQQQQQHGSSSDHDEIRFHLRELDLGDNKIDQLGSFSDHDHAEDGALSNAGDNSYAELGGGDEEKAMQSTKIGHKKLKSSDLERLAPFLTLTRLETLNLSGNKLARLHQHVFLGLIRLKQLDLSKNQIEFVDKHALVGLIELEVLKLAQNKLARHLYQVSLAFCRAPTNELRYLDLSDNQKSQVNLNQEVMLPNQMFICAPRLVSLRLDGLKLRYIQVNAFDNLLHLETLNLSRNLLEQVPSDSLSYQNSNLSLSLRQLDLSDTLIEFVNARSFSSLKNLQKLSMNSMQRLVSFDLAAMSVQYELPTSDDSYLSAMQNLFSRTTTAGGRGSQQRATNNLPKQETTSDKQQHQWQQWQHQDLVGTSINQNSPTNSWQLTNGQLIELQLRRNSHLQSLHSSLASQIEQPKGRIKFSKLKLLDLQGASELRKLPLDTMIDVGALTDDLRLDLSYVSKLNCSSCQMSWLVETMRQQQQQRQTGLPDSPAPSWTPLIPFDPYQGPPASQPPGSRPIKITLASDAIGCSWPFAMPLSQLLELETSFAPLFGHCGPSESPESHSNQDVEPKSFSSSSQSADSNSNSSSADTIDDLRSMPDGRHRWPPPSSPSAATEGAGSNYRGAASQVWWLVAMMVVIGAACLVCLVGSVCCLKPLLTLARIGLRRVRQSSSGGSSSSTTTIPARQCEFDWRSPSLTTTSQSLGSPGGSAAHHQANNNGCPSHSPADCSSSSILSTAAIVAPNAGLVYCQQPCRPAPLMTAAPAREKLGFHQQQTTTATTTSAEQLRKLELELERSRQQQQQQQLQFGQHRRLLLLSQAGTQPVFADGGGAQCANLLVFNDFNNVGQIERAHRRGNLFSRFVERLRGNSSSGRGRGASSNGSSWLRSRDESAFASKSRSPAAAASMFAASSRKQQQLQQQTLTGHYSTLSRDGQQPSPGCLQQAGSRNAPPAASRIIESVVYGGGDKILAGYTVGSGLQQLNERAALRVSRHQQQQGGAGRRDVLVNHSPLASAEAKATTTATAMPLPPPPPPRDSAPESKSSPLCSQGAVGANSTAGGAPTTSGSNSIGGAGTNFIKPAYTSSACQLLGQAQVAVANLAREADREGEHGEQGDDDDDDELAAELANCKPSDALQLQQQLGSAGCGDDVGSIVANAASAARRGENQLIIESTRATAAVGQQQLPVKQLEAIGTDLRALWLGSPAAPAGTCRSAVGQQQAAPSDERQDGRDSLASAAAGSRRKPWQRQDRAEQRLQSHSSGLPTNEPAPSSAAGSNSQVLVNGSTDHDGRPHEGRAPGNCNLYAGAGQANTSAPDNGTLSPLFGVTSGAAAGAKLGKQQRPSSATTTKNTFGLEQLSGRQTRARQRALHTEEAAALHDPGTLLVDGHVYVTLDGPIKQQNDSDEYGDGCKSQQPPQQPAERTTRRAQQRGKSESVPPEREVPSSSSAALDAALTMGDFNKSFEWLEKQRHQRPLSVRRDSKSKSCLEPNDNNNKPLKVVDKFKSDQTARADGRQEAGQFARPLSKLSSSAGTKNRPATTVGDDECAQYVAASFEEQQSSLSSEMEIYDNQMVGHNDFAAVAKNRKRRGSSEKGPERLGEAKLGDLGPSESNEWLQRRANARSRFAANDNVTGQSDYGGPSADHNGSPARSDAGSQHHQFGQQQQQQLLLLFLDSNSSNVGGRATDEAGAWASRRSTTNAAANSAATTTASAGGRLMMDDSVAGCLLEATASKYDANHADDTACGANKAPHSFTAAAAAADQTSNKTGSVAPTTACDDDYVINGLHQQRTGKGSARYGGNLADAGPNRERQQQQQLSWAAAGRPGAGQSKLMGVAPASSAGTTGAQNNGRSVNNATSSHEEINEPDSIMIGQQKFVPNWADKSGGSSLRQLNGHERSNELGSVGDQDDCTGNNFVRRPSERGRSPLTTVRPPLPPLPPPPPWAERLTNGNQQQQQQHPSKSGVIASEFSARNYLASEQRVNQQRQNFCDSSCSFEGIADYGDSTTTTTTVDWSNENSPLRAMQHNSPAIISAASNDRFRQSLDAPSDKRQGNTVPSNVSSKGDSYPANQNEIYSNQFYYCKPSGAASTLNRKRANNDVPRQGMNEESRGLQ